MSEKMGVTFGAYNQRRTAAMQRRETMQANVMRQPRASSTSSTGGGADFLY